MGWRAKLVELQQHELDQDHRLLRTGEVLRSLLMPWRWGRRRRCHGSILVCQYTDRPNDNSGDGWIPWPT